MYNNMNLRDGPGDYVLLPDRRRRKITQYVDANRSKQLPRRSRVITRSVFGRDFIPPPTHPPPFQKSHFICSLLFVRRRGVTSS